MTDGQFNHAKFKKEQIEANEHLKSRMLKVYNNIRNDDFEKEIVLELISDLGNSLNQLIEIRKQEFKEI